MAENGWCGGRPAELLRRIDGALLPALGGLGRFQKRLLLLTWIPALLIGFSSFSDSFLLTQPDHNQQNQRNQQCDNTSNTSNTSCVCLEERELINGLEQNVVTKWNLVCDSAWIVHIAKFSLLVGSILGYLVLGVLADWFGRHPVLILSVFFTLVFGVAVAFSVNVPMFGTLRFFEGFCLAGITLALYALRIELCLPGWRFSVTMVSNFVVLAGQLLMPGVAVLCRDWQVLQVVIISPLLLMMTYIWIFPESLRWLLATQQLRQSRWIMQQTAEKNGVRLEPEMEELMAELGDAPQGQSKRTCIVRMVGTRTLWKNIVVLCVNSLTGYGIHHCFARSMMDQETDAATMFHNFYADYYTMGGIAVASCVALCPAVSVMGRRGGLLMFMIITALASLLQLGLLNLLGKYSVQLNIERSDTLKSNFSVAFSIIGMFSSHAVSNLSIFFCAEITPTVIRGGGLGLVLASAGFGMLTAPIMELHNQKGYFLHHIIFACCTLICIICILLLPETRDEPLPEMLTDAENYTRRPLLPHRPAEQLRLLTKPPPDSTASSLLDLPVITDTPTRQVFGVEAESEDPEALPNISALIDKQSVCAASAPPTSGRVTAPSLAELQACPDGVLLHIVESPEEVGGSPEEVGGSQKDNGSQKMGGSREEMGGSQVETDSAALVTPHSTADAPPTETPANCQTQAPPPASSGHSPAAPPRSQTSDPRGVEPSGTLQGGAEDTPS